MRVGLTGGIASGKSTVSAMLRELGALVIDSDQLARQVVEKGTSGLAAVVAEFGTDVLTDEEELDRPRLAAIVFADDEARKRLERIVHPLVRAASLEAESAAGTGRLVVHDVPLLVESGLTASFDRVIVVDAPREEAVRRMVAERGWTEHEAEARIAAQASRQERLDAATDVIDNSGTFDDLRSQVERLHESLMADMTRRPSRG